MPVYDFRCNNCGEISEFRVPGYSTSDMVVCSSCGSSSMERLISAPSILKSTQNAPGTTCCGREERCETPPCSMGEACRRH